jgi:outer membrane protein insertion porin family
MFVLLWMNQSITLTDQNEDDLNITSAQIKDEVNNDQDDEEKDIFEDRIIKNIFIHGNKQVSAQAILNKIPYQIGQIFDPNKSRELIRKLYYEFKRFRNIKVMAELEGEDALNLYIIIEEKIPLKEIIFDGNSALSEKEIKEKIPALESPSIDQEELKTFADAILRLYLEKGYYFAKINPELQVDDQSRGTLIFHINEESKSLVKKISFTGNKSITSKKLRSILYTKEDWLLGFLDQSGVYLPDRIEADKHAIETYYQSNGFMNAKVYNVISDLDPSTKNFNLIFEIDEGDLYTISDVQVSSSSDLIPQETLRAIVNIKPGEIYSREKIADAMKNLELVWGNYGYLYAHVEPSINPDDDNKTVSLSFHTDLGNQITLNKLTIRGNRKTKDKIIRRQIVLEEGGLLSNSRLEETKERLQSLGYFDPKEGVNWKIMRTDDKTADVDLMLKESKTGHAGFQLGFAGSPDSIKEPWRGLSMDLNVGDTNLFGTGIRTNLSSKLSHEDFTLLFNVAQPWLFDRPIYGGMDVFHKRLAYEDFNFTPAVNERDTGLLLTSGFVTSFKDIFLRDTYVRGSLGFDRITYQQKPTATIDALLAPERQEAETAYNVLLNKMFRPGNYGSFILAVGQDKKNHPMHPTRGYTWLLRSQSTFTISDSILGFNKFDFEGHWFTPLIGAYDLIFHIHGYFGLIASFHNRLIPYRELFHIGGPASVRGFLYGQIGPQFTVRAPDQFGTDSIGGSKAFFINTELIIPITPDFNLKGVLFYDGGAGWDNPYADLISQRFILNNSFNYRHSVGFGVRMYNPVPIRVDVGFKLDKRKNEGAYEVHFTTAYEW